MIPTDQDDTALESIWRAGGYLPAGVFKQWYRSPKYGEKRIRTLENGGYLARFTDPSPRSSRGPVSLVLYLTNKGAERVANRVGVPWKQMCFRLAPPSKMRGLPHRLETARVLILLDIACRRTREFTCAFRTEETLHESLPGTTALGYGAVGEHHPDGYIEIASSGDVAETASFFLEVDRGGETIQGTSALHKTLRAKFGCYTELFSSGQDDGSLQRFGVDPRRGMNLLVVTHGERRLKNILKLAVECGLAASTLLALEEDITCEQVLSPIWRSAEQSIRRESLIGEKNYRRLATRIAGRAP